MCRPVALDDADQVMKISILCRSLANSKKSGKSARYSRITFISALIEAKAFLNALV
jgi:hypothetical protein